MKGTTHLTLGALSSFVVMSQGDFQLVYLVFGALGGLWPDIDASDAKIGHIGIGRGPNKIKPFRIFTLIFSTLFKHRGWVHSLLGLGVFTFLLSFILINFTEWDYVILPFCFALGYLSHLLSDSITYSGVPLFFPLYRKKIHVVPESLRIETGSTVENTLEIVSLFFIGFTILYLYHNGYLLDLEFVGSDWFPGAIY